MNIIRIKDKIKNAVTAYRNMLTVIELSKYSTSQLADAGISKQLLSKGYDAYPWHLELASQETPDNVTTINTANQETAEQGMPKRPKAA